MNKEPNDPLLMDHEADGIRELDNNLPRWWVWLFVLCTVFAVGYIVYYHVLRLGSLQAAEYQAEAAQGDALKNAALARFESDLATLKPVSDSVVLEQGKQFFANLCAPCHRADGGGLVGPNLCDRDWSHGSNYVDTVKVIINGVAEKGMLSWRGVLKPAEIQAVASYIYTLRGSNPPDPKPPEDPSKPVVPMDFE
jgi:cytochrome c oxidase cbb3-type subunit 3